MGRGGPASRRTVGEGSGEPASPGDSESVEQKSRVEYLGVELAPFEKAPERAERTGPLKILWNHGWEFDKAPKTLFGILEALKNDGCEFQLFLCGETFKYGLRELMDDPQKARGRSLRQLVRRFDWAQRIHGEMCIALFPDCSMG